MQKHLYKIILMMILLINVERENSLHIHSFKKKYNTVTYTKELTKQIKKK